MSSDHYLNILTDSQVVSDHKFKTSDNPGLECTDTFTLAGDQVDVLKPAVLHYLYIAVRAKGPDINGSADVLTQRAKLEWNCDGEGTVDVAGDYSFTGAGVSGDGSYTEVQDGSIVPEAEDNFSELLEGQSWITENQ